MPVIQISTTNYDENIAFIKKALINLESICNVTNGYALSAPESTFGWTFLKIALKLNFVHEIDKKFSDMISKSKGGKFEEKFTNFLSDYFESRDCKIKLKLLEF